MWVLTYHSISDGPPPLCIGPDRLAAQLDALLEAGWRPAPIADALSDAPDPRSFALTFDDGYRDFADTALPILEARALPAALFVPASDDRSGLDGGLPDRALLAPDELREVAARGVTIGAHGLSHRPLPQLPDEQLERELSLGRSRLLEWTGRAVEWLAYPFGRFDARVVAAAQAGYAGAFTTQLAAAAPRHHLHALPRIDAFYLDHAGLMAAARRGTADTWLTARRWLRRLRGSEPRRPIPGRRHRRGDGPTPVCA